MASKHRFDHSKMKASYDTLGEIFQDIEEVYGTEVPLHTGGVKYEETLRMCLDVGLPKAKLQVQIYRLQSGRYEYNGYIL
jgi:hypothetical protein